MNAGRLSSLNGQARTYELVLDHLRSAILDGTLQPGEHIKTADLADQMGVSRMPVREALHRLEVEGLVMMQPYRGIVVAPLSAAGVRDAYELLSVIESLAARKAAAIISDGKLAELTGFLERMEEARAQADPIAYSAANRGYHSVIYDLYDNERAQEIMQHLWNYVYRLRRVYPQSADRMRKGMDEHRAIFAALEAHDEAQAEALVRRHVENSAANILEEIKKNPGATLDLEED